MSYTEILILAGIGALVAFVWFTLIRNGVRGGG